MNAIKIKKIMFSSIGNLTYMFVIVVMATFVFSNIFIICYLFRHKINQMPFGITIVLKEFFGIK